MSVSVSGAPLRWSLRPDLQVSAADASDGAPALLVHDPVPGTYDRVEWPESDLLRLLRSPIGLDDLLARFRAMNVLAPSRDEVAAYVAELGRRGWLRGDALSQPAYREPPRPGLLRRFSSLLFLQMPLLRPERFLASTVGAVRAVLNPVVRALLFAVFPLGMYLSVQRWEEYWRDSLGGVTWSGLPFLLLAIILVKTCHEFSHAYCATALGVRVPVMGVALFFGMPLLYTDVSDAWRLSWRDRLSVAAAGLKAEAALAGIALFLWALSPPGAASAALARLSSVALASTVLTNLNPGPRFDGYYLLAALLRVENLRSRGALLLWDLIGRGIFGFRSRIGADIRRRRVAVLAFSAYSLVYRVALGAGLILMIYRLPPKALGLPLAALTAWLFFGAPLVRIGSALWRERNAMRPTLPGIVLILVLSGLAVWICGSWPRRLDFPAVTRAEVEEAVRTRSEGALARVVASVGDVVGEGDVLASLEIPWEADETRLAEWRLREAEMAEDRARRLDASRGEAGWRAAETERRRAERETLRHAVENLDVTAPAPGTLIHWERDLAPGTPLPRGKLLGWIVDGDASLLTAYVPVASADRFAPGATARFFSDAGDEALCGEVLRIDPSRTETLDHPQLAGPLGAVPAGDGSLVLPGPYARVTVKMERPAARIGQTGRVWVWTRPESLLARARDWLRALALRESAF